MPGRPTSSTIPWGLSSIAFFSASTPFGTNSTRKPASIRIPETMDLTTSLSWAISTKMSLKDAWDRSGFSQRGQAQPAPADLREAHRHSADIVSSSVYQRSWSHQFSALRHNCTKQSWILSPPSPKRDVFPFEDSAPASKPAT